MGDIYYGTLNKGNVRLSPKTGSKDLAVRYNYLYAPLRSIKLRRIYRLLYVTAVRFWSATDPLAKTSFKKHIVCVCLFVCSLYVDRVVRHTAATPRRLTGLPHEAVRWSSAMAGRRRVSFVKTVPTTEIFSSSIRQQVCVLDI